MSPGNVVGDTSDTKSRYEFTAAPQNVKHKKTTIDDFNSITTTSHPPPQNPPPLTTLPPHLDHSPPATSQTVSPIHNPLEPSPHRAKTELIHRNECYIPPNNEQNEPTQGDIGETSNKPNQATRNEFEELYASANEELHPGALEGGPIRPRWMFPFERYMKKLKGYVRNKAKPEGSIAEGYVAEEALTFSYHYFQDVTTKFNHPDSNVDPPPPTCQFQVFRSVCKLIGLRSVIRFDAQELKKVKWYVLHNIPEIDTYRSQFKRFRQRHVDNDKDPEVSTTSELFALACGPTWTPISINSCVVDGVTYVVHNREERRTTQNSGICSPGPDGEMYYGQLQEILEFKYLLFKVCVPIKLVTLATKDIKSNDDPDIIHFDNSSDLPLSTSLNDLDNATLHIDGQSTEVDAPPDIIDVVDQDDDITDDEDALPHDLADSDDEDLINVDDDGVDKMSADVARSHGGDGGGEDRPPPHHVPTGCMGCFANRGKGKRKPNLGGRAAGRLNTRDKTRNLSLKEITDKKGPVPIRFELRDKQTLMPLGDHAAHWSSYIGEVIRGVPLYYPSWLKVPKEQKAALITDIGVSYPFMFISLSCSFI
ncbi:hypothetical protein Tco_0960201 [Tanacetum coccineum]